MTDYANEAWSRVTHSVSLTPATLKNGKKALIATWEAKAEYYWGFSWYPENYASPYNAYISFATLRLKKSGAITADHNHDFSGGFDSSGRFRHDVVIADLEPGTYELYLGTLNTKKEGGYWQYSKAALTTEEKDSGRYTRIDDFRRSTVTATI